MKLSFALIWRRFIKIITLGIILFTLKGCFGLYYSEMSHMWPGELKWTENVRNNILPNCIDDIIRINGGPIRGTSIKFISDSASTSTLRILSFWKSNSLNPFVFSFQHSDIYIANSSYDFVIKGSKADLEGRFAIFKDIDNGDLEVSARLGNLQAGSRYVARFPDSIAKPYIIAENLSSFSVGGKVLDNCLVFDKSNSQPYEYMQAGDSVLVDKFVISRDFGPVYYRLVTGEEFFRDFASDSAGRD